MRNDAPTHEWFVFIIVNDMTIRAWSTWSVNVESLSKKKLG